MRLDWIPANRELIGGLALDHLALALPPVLASLLIAVPLGWAATRMPRGGPAVVTAAGLLYAIPSLALFVVLPPVLGTSVLSPLNVVVALTVYGTALLTRTAADAFGAIPAAAVDAATAVGYGPARRVLAVELPLAGPVILAGVRVVSASSISLTSVGALIGVPGLGYLFTDGFNRSFPTEILTGVLATVLLAVAADLLIVAVGRLLLPWRAAAGKGA